MMASLVMNLLQQRDSYVRHIGASKTHVVFSWQLNSYGRVIFNGSRVITEAARMYSVRWFDSGVMKDG